MRPLLVIDFQPAYAKCFGSWMTREVLALMRGMSPAEPIVVVSVNEELSGDDATSIQEFWIEQGMDEELMERVTFLEKPYAFFRSWMDQGVEDHEIVAGRIFMATLPMTCSCGMTAGRRSRNWK